MHVDLDVQMVKALGKKVRRVLQLQNVAREPEGVCFSKEERVVNYRKVSTIRMQTKLPDMFLPHHAHGEC
jgi:hypothetical protein